jgi:nucleoside-diphosphate-sugar epimerase
MHIAVFGIGFIGGALIERAEAAGHRVSGYSRSRAHGAGARLDAATPEAARILEGAPGRQGASGWDALVVTFAPQAIPASFWETIHPLAPRRILLGSTSIYQRALDCSQPVITEQTPLVPDHPRLAVEQAFREAGGMLVRLAGLYGGDRNPVRWIQAGKVGYEKRQINLVHRDDVADALLGLLARSAEPPLASVYNLADGQRHTWRQIIDALVAAGHLDPGFQDPRPPKKADAFVDPSRIRAALPDLRLRDLHAALDRLMRD